MPVIVDRESLAADELGLSTVGQVLSHLQKPDRLVVHVLIDGEEPDLSRMSVIRQVPVQGHTLYIETADPRRLAVDILDGAEEQLAEADRLKAQASDLLQQGQTAQAMQKLAGCFSIWQNTQESMLKTAQLLRIDPASIESDGRPLTDMLAEFMQHLQTIKSALEQRDFVLLNDVLLYETTQTAAEWASALRGLRTTITSLR